MTETTTGWPEIDDPDTLTDRLRTHGYLAGEGLVAAAFLALQMGRPLFLEGDPGVGKTDFASKIATVLDARMIRLQCHAGMDTTQALYEWNFPKQILALRAMGENGDPATILPALYSEDYLLRRPVLQALRGRPAVLLIDEIDRADDEFEALLLEFLEAYTVSVPELGPVVAEVRPMVILTSNRTREVHDALKRRCLYHWITHPGPEREAEILRLRVPRIPDLLARQIAIGLKRVRTDPNLVKPPGVSECLDFAEALTARGATTLTPDAVDATICTLVKQHEDHDPVRDGLLGPPRPREGA
jgi:MoxR-like ATPase